MKSISLLKASILQNQYLWILAAIILLIPTLFFPINADLSIYVLGGESLLNGKKLYVDFIDLKPPLFYYYFAGIVKIFGRSEIGIRFFDFLVQALTSFLIFKTVKAFSKNTLFAGIACVLYPIIYTSMGYAQTYQGESLITPVTIAVLLMQKYNTRNIMRYVAMGLMIGFAIGIKYPLGIILVMVFFDDLLSKDLKFKQVLFKNLIIAVSAFVIFAISLLPLLDHRAYDGFLHITNFVSVYSTRPAYNLQFLISSLKAIAGFLGDNISFFITGSVFVSIFYILMRKIDYENTEKLLSKSLLFSLFFIFSIFVERKFHDYYFVRMLSLWIILAAYPISELANNLKLNFSKYRAHTKFITIIILLMAVYFSPAVRYTYRLKSTAYYFLDKSKYNAEYEKQVLCNHRVQWLEIADFLNHRSAKYIKAPYLLNIQTGSSPINYFTPKLKHSAFQQAQFFLSVEAPQIWKDKFIAELHQVDFLSIENNDIHPALNGHYFSSQAYFFQQKGNPFADNAREYILRNFSIVFKTANFNIYERNKHF